MDSLTQVTITVDGMRHTLVRAMGPWFDEQEAAVVAAIDKAIAEFDLQAEIAVLVREDMRRWLANMVCAAVQRVCESPAVEETIRGAIAAQAAERRE